MTKWCPHCHQPMPEWRAGVRLSPLKAHIFDVIKRANCEGVTLETINALCFDGCSNAVNIRTHIHQINDALRLPGPICRSPVRPKAWSGFFISSNSGEQRDG